MMEARAFPALRPHGAASYRRDIEVLTPDFKGRTDCVDRILSARPEVFNHNLETVARLQQHVRRKSQYDISLKVLQHVKTTSPTTRTKSGLMLGLGETTEELVETLADLRSIGCDFLTLGQYLQPSTRHLPVRDISLPTNSMSWKNRPLARIRGGCQRALRPLQLPCR